MTMQIHQVPTQVARRLRQIRGLLRAEGVQGLDRRTRRAIAQWLSPHEMDLPVWSADVLAADLNRPHTPELLMRRIDEPLRINWVTTPPSPGSGGHSTLFRIINYLQSRGYLNRVYLYDVHRADHAYYVGIVRNIFGFTGPIASATDSMENAHAVVASAWPTAFAVFNARCTGRRYYFVQDLEHSFYPASTHSVLAENTYRMGFHGITAGVWLARQLRSRYGMQAEHFDFGCDVSKYKHVPDQPRNGIAFYARPDAARRGFELGVMALEIFAKRNPSAKVHLYGDRIGRLPFEFVDHGRVTPEQLNAIYGSCYAGLSLSLTNVSLVPHEMLAAGCIPVVNDAEHNRVVLCNPFVKYAQLTPHALASALEEISTMDGFQTISRAASASVRSTSWDDAGAAVHNIFQRGLSPSAAREPGLVAQAEGQRHGDIAA